LIYVLMVSNLELRSMNDLMHTLHNVECLASKSAYFFKAE